MRMGTLVLGSLFITLSILSHPILAEVSHTACTNTTLSTHYNYVYTNDTEVNQTTQTLCAFGCNPNSGMCNPDPYSSESVSLFYFLFPLASLILVYFSSSIKKEDWPMSILLGASALILLIVPFGYLSDVLLAFSIPYYLLWLVFFVFIFYYMINLFVRSYKEMSKGAK